VRTGRKAATAPGRMIFYVIIIKIPITSRFKLNTEYTISATFLKMVKNEDTNGNGNPVAIFSGEQAHLSLMSEYGL
jgi:hypothetical protein